MGAGRSLSASRRRVSRSALHGLSAEAVIADQRQRIRAAVGESVSRRGYQATAVIHIIDRAGVSRRTFYELYAGKEKAFCASHSEAMALLAEEVRVACEVEAEWQGKTAAAIDAALRWAADEPHRAHLIAAEPFTAGPRPAYCHDLLVERFAPLLRRGRRQSPLELPPSLEAGLIGGLAGVVATHLRAGEAAALPDRAPSLTRFVLAPYVGPQG